MPDVNLQDLWYVSVHQICSASEVHRDHSRWLNCINIYIFARPMTHTLSVFFQITNAHSNITSPVLILLLIFIFHIIFISSQVNAREDFQTLLKQEVFFMLLSLTAMKRTSAPRCPKTGVLTPPSSSPRRPGC